MDETSCRDALLGAIRDDPDYAAGTSKALVFAGETGSADQISGLLHEAGVTHVVYHKNRAAGERAAALELMAAPPAPKDSASKVGGWVECTALPLGSLFTGSPPPFSNVPC